MPFLPFVYGYPSSCPRAHCTPNKSAPTLRYTRMQVHARRLLPSAVPWISEDRLLKKQNEKDTHNCNALDKAMSFRYFSLYFRQFGTADAEMKVTCAENPGDCLFLLLLF